MGQPMGRIVVESSSGLKGESWVQCEIIIAMQGCDMSSKNGAELRYNRRVRLFQSWHESSQTGNICLVMIYLEPCRHKESFA